MQNVLKKGLTTGTSTKTASQLHRESIAKEILGILDYRFHHTCAPLSRTQIEVFRIIELENIIAFLSGDRIIKSTNSSKRPECPVKNRGQHSLARYEYKQGMCDYIASFGYTLTEFVCNYGASFLEALANYCEYRTGDEKKALVLPFRKK